MTSTTPLPPDLYDSYAELYPIISGLLMWAIVIALFIGCRHCCNKCSRKMAQCSDRLSRLMATNRPCSYCWTYEERTDDLSTDDTSINRFSDPPAYSIALDMPKPDHHAQHTSQSSDNGEHYIFVNEGFHDDSMVSEQNSQDHVEEIPVSLHRPETDPDLPSYDEALRTLSLSEDSPDIPPAVNVELIDEDSDSDDTGLRMHDVTIQETSVTIEHAEHETEDSDSVTPSEQSLNTHHQVVSISDEHLNEATTEDTTTDEFTEESNSSANVAVINIATSDEDITCSSAELPRGDYVSRPNGHKQKRSSHTGVDVLELCSIHSVSSEASLPPVQH